MTTKHFKFPASIPSRPVYGRLEARQGTSSLMVADAEGAEAILELAQKSPAIMKTAHVIFIPGATGNKYIKKLEALKPDKFFIGPSYGASVQRLRRVLHDGDMGMQIYLAGTEGLMGQAMNEAIVAGFPHTAIQTEHRGSVARRMQCVHCKGITENVMTDPFVCAHCGLNLFVRDHYSRRIAAFQGVRVDAEDPGDVPKSVELYK